MMSETRSGDNDRLPLRFMDEDDREEEEDMFVLSLPRFPSPFLCVVALKASSNESVSLRRW